MSEILCMVENCLSTKGVSVTKKEDALSFDARSNNRKKFTLGVLLRPDNNALLFNNYMPPLEDIERLSENHREAVRNYLKTLLARSEDGIYYRRDPATGQIYVETKLYGSSANFCKHFFDACAGIADLREHLEDDLKMLIDP